MPSTSKRRRKFSVQNAIANRKTSRNQKDQSSFVESDINAAIPSNILTSDITADSCKFINNSQSNVCDSATSISDTNFPERLDKEVSVCSTIIKLGTLLTVDDLPADQLGILETMEDDSIEKQDIAQIHKEKTLFRREKHPHQHRIKVRSPKRRLLILDQGKPTEVLNNFVNRRSVGTLVINWKEEFQNISGTESVDEDERPSTHSLEDMCRICHGGESLSLELGGLISACACRGTVGRVHVKCLERWLTESGKSRCELCGTRYSTRRVHRYGVARALLMWILSQNAKQLMVDSLGIMLMSPLAVLAAWLSGRTLAGLMTQDSHKTPWPLASTFVLACMTLVCYYCWIVSAATRHALGWWIWYRSQYEVRLEMQENET